MKILDIKLTYACNNKCILCCQDNDIKNSRSTLEFEEIYKILYDNYKEFIESGEEIKLVLTGGEPTLHSDIFKVIKVAKKLGYRQIQLQTNATKLVDIEFTKKLVELGVNSFGISLHGHSEKIHESFTKTVGSFNNVVLALKELKKYNVNISINTVVSKLNIDYLKDIMTFIGQEDISQTVQFAFIHITGRAAEQLDLVVSISAVAKKIKECFVIADKYGIKLTTEAIPFCLLRGYEKQVSELYFKDDIIVYDKNSKIVFNNYRKNNFKYKVDKCKLCLFFNLCEGPWKEYGDIYGWEEFIPIKEF